MYFAKDGNTSFGTYAQGGATWRNSQLYPQSCAALAEIVNLPEKFVSSHPHYVVADTTWIVWYATLYHALDRSIYVLHSRYLLVSNRNGSSAYPSNNATTTTVSKESIPMVPMDPSRRVTIGGKNISIPLPEYKLEKLRRDRENEYMEEDPDEDDISLFTDPAPMSSQPNGAAVYETEEQIRAARPANDWKHDPDWVRATIAHMMPAPNDSTSIATMALQRELNSMLKEQDRAASLRELGWYMPPEFIEDNLYQWIVELHSFDKELPIAKDLTQRKVNSLVFEIRFPPSFPHSPPFFRILKPRFLPFIQVHSFSSTPCGRMLTITCEYRGVVATLLGEGRSAWTCSLPTVGSRVTASLPFSSKSRWLFPTSIQSPLGWPKTGTCEFCFWFFSPLLAMADFDTSLGRIVWEKLWKGSDAPQILTGGRSPESSTDSSANIRT